MTQPAATLAQAPRAQIHDQGYERYTGPRREQSRRFWIVARNVVWTGLRRWAVRVPAIASVFIFLVSGVFMFIARQFGGTMPVPKGVPDFDRLAGVLVQAGWWLGWWGMVVGAAVGCTSISDDLRVGAFQFYFSRSLRSIDYGLGKILGICFLVGIPMLVVPSLLGLLRLGLTEDAGSLGKTWTVFPRAIAWGVLGTLVYALPAAGLGAAVVSKRTAQAGYVAYYMVVSFIALLLSKALKIPQLELIAFDHCWQNVGQWIFEIPENPNVPPSPPAWQSMLALLGFIGLGAAGLVLRLRQADVSSVGGGS